MKRVLRWLALALLLALIQTAAWAEDDDALLEEDAFPPLNKAGFMDEGEFVYTDEEAGVWRYCSQTLRIEINRREQEKPDQRWYEAEIWLAEGTEGFRMLSWSDTKR